MTSETPRESALRLLTLGGLGVEGRDFNRPKLLLLLAYLAVEGPRDRRFLAELFWPDGSEPMTSLRVGLAALRSGLPDSVATDGNRVSTLLDTDVRQFLRAADDGAWAEAVALYPGPFLRDIRLTGWSAELEEWVYVTREHLAARAAGAHLLLGERSAAEGNLAEATAHGVEAWQLAGPAGLDPEGLARVHRLLVAGGDTRANNVRAEAAEFGMELGSGRDEALRQLSVPRTLSRPSLPLRSAPLLGRDPELLELARLLEAPANRLITVTGPGGIGKTRLALQAALGEPHGDRFADGVYFVPLETITDAALLPAAVAAAMNERLRGRSDALSELADLLTGRSVLLLLDNLEQIAGIAESVAALLAAAPLVTVLATSRTRLDLSGEQVLPLQGLSLAGDAAGPEEARLQAPVQLFLHRARRVRPDFELDADALGHVQAICARLGGSPLAIELAAGWVRTLPVAVLAEELARDLELLEDAPGDFPERHRGTRASFMHSWQLLNEQERSLLTALTVFRGGFTHGDAAAVAGAGLRGLAALVDRSLLAMSPAGRFEQHPLLSEYAHELLARDGERLTVLRDAHLRHWLETAEEAASHLRDSEQLRWLRRLDLEQENLRAALDHALTAPRVPEALLLVIALTSWWSLRGRPAEGSEVIARALELAAGHTGAGIAPQLLAGATRAAGTLALHRGDIHAARVQLEAACDLYEAAGDREGLAASLHNLGNVLAQQGADAEAGRRYGRSLALMKEVGNLRGQASALYGLGVIARRVGNTAESVARLSESLELLGRLGDEHGTALVMTALGNVEFGRGDMNRAGAYYEEALVVYQRVGDRPGSATALHNIGVAALRRGELARAARRLSEGLELRVELGELAGVESSLGAIASLARSRGQGAQAVTLWAAADWLGQETGNRVSAGQRSEQEQERDLVRAVLGEQEYEAAWQSGSTLPLAEAVAAALVVTRETLAAAA